MAFVKGSVTSETLIGTNGEDVILGKGGHDILFGHNGDDWLEGGEGDDTFWGGLGADYMDGGRGSDTAEYLDSASGVLVSLMTHSGVGGSAQGDQLYAIENLSGSFHSDILEGNSRENTLLGRGGNDLLKGGGGADEIMGGDGIDTASYESSSGGVLVYLGVISHYGDAEGDELFEIENLTGSQHDDWLTGHLPGNVLAGLAGDDTLSGQWGNDILIGGAGKDELTGGFDADTFVWSSTDHTGVTAVTADLITDFSYVDGDRIDLSAIDANIYAAGNQAFTFIGSAAFSGAPGEIRYYYASGNTYLEMQTGTSVDVEGVIALDGSITPQASWFAL